ncbi:hypothetical protein [Parachitinimonas caeni]|uniref:Tetratricopeptide repeat protein n=1 Tax=Parachitinimonas caeni TaxID=3031301 RepID=A0ABT7E2H5_9NEIS|nr:hypothetical protein [Parachitinimonas caeni]MDK2126506.1 hypothetical protein [Parachitinimonas caeni]
MKKIAILTGVAFALTAIGYKYYHYNWKTKLIEAIQSDQFEQAIMMLEESAKQCRNEKKEVFYYSLLLAARPTGRAEEIKNLINRCKNELSQSDIQLIQYSIGTALFEGRFGYVNKNKSAEWVVMAASTCHLAAIEYLNKFQYENLTPIQPAIDLKQCTHR